MEIEKAIVGAVDRALEQERNHETKESIRAALSGLPCTEAVDILTMMAAEYRWRAQFEKDSKAASRA